MPDGHLTLSSFITRYIRDHNITVHELSRNTKIAHSTLDRWIAGTSTPTLKQLDILARYTHVDLCYLVDLVVPDRTRRERVVADDLANRISQLPQDWQDVVDAVLIGLAAKSTNKIAKE